MKMNFIETITLKKYFGDTRAVDNVSLTVAEREFVSLVGPNGAGKTSLVNVISALLPSNRVRSCSGATTSPRPP